MLNGLYLFGFIGSRYREMITIFEQTLEQRLPDTPLLGRLFARRWGYLHWWYQEDYEEAFARIEQALAIAQAENNQFEIAFCQLILSYIMVSMHRYADAVPPLEISQALFEALGETYYVCWVLHRLGYMYYNLNQITRAAEYTEQSLSLARASHNRTALAICLYNLGSDYILKGNYVKGQHYCAEALHIATESGHQGQTAHTLSLLALCALCQGEYAICRNYAERAHAITEDLNRFIFHAYNLSLLLLLACLREDYAEGVRLNELGKRHSTNTMGFQILYWARATLACGVGDLAEARICIHNVVKLFDLDTNTAPTIWIVPCAAHVLAATDPQQAVELVAWARRYLDIALSWVREWPLFERLQIQLQAAMDSDTYDRHWEKGSALSVEAVASSIRDAFRAESDAAAPEAGQQALLTVREREILGLLAAGMTNPQIAAQLVIGAGTVKTHTLNIYRKLEVANRTQAIVRAQEIGLLHA
jgi:ATP/maltotriose-dependent transcriptional regulator MalT